MKTVKIPNIGTDRSEQTVQTQIRLLPKEQSDQDLHCLPFYVHLVDILLPPQTNLLHFHDYKDNYFRFPNFRIFQGSYILGHLKLPLQNFQSLRMLSNRIKTVYW